MTILDKPFYLSINNCHKSKSRSQSMSLVQSPSSTFGLFVNLPSNSAELRMVLNVSFSTGMRRMFYLLSPEESSYEKSEDVPKYINEAYPFFVLFVVMEVLISVYKQDKKVRLNDSLTSVSAGMYSRLPMLIIPSISIVTYVWIYNHFNIINLPWNSPWTWWLCFLGVDLGYYWFHRLAHEVNFMWAAHQVHHSSEDYNFSTALRQSVLQIYTSWIFYLPLALFIPPPIFIAHNELNILYQFWIHTQYIRSLGPLEYVLNTPSHHRVHHGRNRYCIDKNYAGTLIIWDRIFGTFSPENEEVAYGLTHPVGTFDATDVQFGYGKYLLQRTNEMLNLPDKMKGLLYGPGWLPGKSRTGDINDIPQIESPVKRYGDTLPTWLNIYVVIHFSLVFISFQILSQKITGFNQTTVILFLLFIGFSLTSFGRLFDDRESGKVMELSRCVIYLLGDIVLTTLDFYSSTFLIQLLRIFFIFSAAIWIIKCRHFLFPGISAKNK